MGIDKTLLRHLLLIDGPWEIGDYQIDLRKRRCDVWVGPHVQRGWLGRPKSAPVKTTQHSWQHLPFGPLRFVLHVSVPSGAEGGNRPAWMGDAGMPFTNALAQQVFFFFNEGLSLQSVCTLMNLSLNDVWRYRFALDNGLAHVQPMDAAQRAGAPAAPAPQTASALPAAATAHINGAAVAGSGAVPDVTDPVWLQLANGNLQLDIKVLSLKLMLTRVRSQLEVISDDEVRLLKLRDLHRYFVKNERVLSHELSQLKVG